MNAATTPKCSVCNHHHEQGTKCPLCGHTGRSKTFQLLQKRPPRNVFNIEGTDCFTRNPSIFNLDVGLWALIKILRGRLFPTYISNQAIEVASRHVVAFIGEAPIATARWRVVTQGDEHAVEIDLFGVLESKRHMGNGKKLLEMLLEDIGTRLVQLQAHCTAVFALIPDNEFAGVCLHVFDTAGFARDTERHLRDGESHLRVFKLDAS